MGDLTRMPLADLLAGWVPGSADWSWEEEFADLRGRDRAVTDAIRARVDADGIGFGDDIQPILLGSDGRVWDGHHRICVAAERGISHVMVDVAGR